MAQAEKDMAFQRRGDYEMKLDTYLRFWQKRHGPIAADEWLRNHCMSLWAERDILQKELANARRQITRLRKGAA